jgi:hypothetical protein
MGFEILIETWAIEERIEKMQAKLQVVPVPAELTAWQTEDMNRKHPITEVINPTTAETRIWPRGRTTRQLRTRQRIISRRVQRMPGKRPILRPELFNVLRARMNLMMTREIKW